MLEKQIKNDKIIITEKKTLSEDFIKKRREYQSKYGNKTKHCEFCNEDIKIFSWQNHIRCKKHKLQKEIYELKSILISK